MTRALLLAAIVIWGWTFVATKICLQHMSAIQLVATRFVLAAPALFLLSRLRRASWPEKRHRRLLLVGVAIFSAHYLIQTWALEFTTATNTGWIIAVTPLSIALLAALLLAEPVPPAMWLGIVVASAGILLLVSQGDLTRLDWLASVGDWMVLSSTGTWALYTIVTRDLSRALDPVMVAFWMTLPMAASALFLPMVVGSWTPLSALDGEAFAALVFLGLGGVALAQWFWQSGIARLGAAKAGLFLYLEPLATTALAVPYLGEAFGLASAVGGALVLSGVYTAQRAGRR